MSNLGMYQFITTLAKKVGGPGKLIALIATISASSGAIGTLAVQYGKKQHKKKKQEIESTQVYTVTTEGHSNEGLLFSVGDSFRVLARDNDAALIVKPANSDNAYYCSAKFLSSISDYSYKD